MLTRRNANGTKLHPISLALFTEGLETPLEYLLFFQIIVTIADIPMKWMVSSMLTRQSPGICQRHLLMRSGTTDSYYDPSKTIFQDRDHGKHDDTAEHESDDVQERDLSRWSCYSD
jgi:hypothetical protein